MLFAPTTVVGGRFERTIRKIIEYWLVGVDERLAKGQRQRSTGRRFKFREPFGRYGIFLVE